MKKGKYTLSPSIIRPSVPFLSAEEAWFWCINAIRTTREGARVAANKSTMARPCDPRDIMAIAARLQRQGRLKPAHLKIMRDFGHRQSPPDRRVHEEAPAALLWDAAMDQLTTPLSKKGIIEPLDQSSACEMANTQQANV